MSQSDLATFHMCTGREAPSPGGHREAWVCVGRRGGKSLVLATVAAFLSCFVDTFEVELQFSRPIKTRMGDLDNPIKPLLDWLQRVELIEDDKYCDRILAQWGEVPLGVRVRLRALKGDSNGRGQIKGRRNTGANCGID
jgi:hypothetical protein